MEKTILDGDHGVIKPLDEAAMKEAAEYQNKLLKPAGSLGTLEAIAIQIAGITGKLRNRLDRRVHFLFGSDHGVYDEGVSASPQHFTRVLMELYASGAGGAINVLCDKAKVKLKLINMGVKGLGEHPAIDSSFGQMPDGTKNMAIEPAMSRDTAYDAIIFGIMLADRAKRDRYKIIGTGEVGMGNTTPAAACIMAALGVSDPDLAVGRGGGLTDEAFALKKRVIAGALRKHEPTYLDPVGIIAKVGGLDIAGMVGLFLGAAENRLPVVIDGVISIAAALLASMIDKMSKHYMIASHFSTEPGYALAMEELGLTPMLTLGMRLGEGTGCPIAMQVIDDALAIMNNMNTFDGASLESAYREKLKA